MRNETTLDAADNNGTTTPRDESDELMWPDFRYVTKNIIWQNSIQIDNRVSQMRICSCRDGYVICYINQHMKLKLEKISAAAQISASAPVHPCRIGTPLRDV